MALTFGAATSDRVVVTANSSINDLTSFSVLMWVYPTTQTGNRRFWRKLGKQAVWLGTDTNDIEFDVTRATVGAQANTSINLSTNTWYFVAFTYDESDGPRVFYAPLGSALAEASYALRTVGSGSTSIDNTEDLVVGNRASATTAFQGRIANFMFVASRLTQGEIERVFRRLLPDANTKVLFHLGWSGTGTHPDLSGNANSGAVTGATVSDHVPLGPAYGFEYGWKGAFTSPGWAHLIGGRRNRLVYAS